MTRAWLPLGVALGALGAFAFGFTLVGLGGWGPPAANEQAIGEISRWCERVAAGLLREPVNTLGNLGFVASGLAMLWTLRRDEVLGRARARFVGHSPTALLYAGATIFLGPGSMLMHATHTRFGAWVDNVSMVAYILVPWLLNVTVLAGWRERTLFGAYALILGGYAAGYWVIGPDLGIGLDLFALSIALWMVSEALYRWWRPGPRSLATRAASGLVGFALAAAFGITPDRMLAAPDDYWWVALFWLPALLARRPAPDRRRYVPWFWLGFGSFFVAFLVWQTGKGGHPLCDPDALLQGHAVWHLLAALATWSFFRFLRTAR